MFYFIRTPWWLQKLYRQATWKMPGDEKVLFISFDDGPHPEITPFVLNELKKFDAKASFFCLGKNIVNNPEVYKRILDEGHAVGNHSFSHLNGWKTKDMAWLDDIEEAKKYCDSTLFRPPYGRITRFQLKALAGPRFQFHTVMWTVLSADFDEAKSPEQCYSHVIKKTRGGDIIVFHDSERAFPRLRYALPMALKYFREKGYRFEKITMK